VSAVRLDFADDAQRAAVVAAISRHYHECEDAPLTMAHVKHWVMGAEGLESPSLGALLEMPHHFRELVLSLLVALGDPDREAVARWLTRYAGGPRRRVQTERSEALHALRLSDHAAWFERVRTAVRTHATRAGCAEELGIPVRTLYNWFHQEPALLDEEPRADVGT